MASGAEAVLKAVRRLFDRLTDKEAAVLVEMTGKALSISIAILVLLAVGISKQILERNIKTMYYIVLFDHTVRSIRNNEIRYDGRELATLEIVQ